MNYIPRRSLSDEVALIEEIVARHPLPEFVDGFEVRLGEFDGDPAMWILFKTSGNEPQSDEAISLLIKQRTALRDAVRHDLLGAIDDRWPYFRFEQALPAG